MARLRAEEVALKYMKQEIILDNCLNCRILIHERTRNHPNRLVEYLESKREKFSAPYGVLSSIEKCKNGKGKYRVVVFGVSRYLDAVIRIFAPNKITIDGQGGLAYKYEGEFKSVDEVIKQLES